MTRLERFTKAAAWWETFHEIDIPALQSEIRERSKVSKKGSRDLRPPG